MADNFGPNNPNWRGGRSIASNGYVIVRRPGHHLADVRGYVYEHRLVAEQKLGRRLSKGEITRQKNGIKHDNHPDNIEVLPSRSHQMAKRRKRKDLRPVGAPNPMVSCKCGCGAKLLRYDATNRPRRYLPSHNMRVRANG